MSQHYKSLEKIFARVAKVREASAVLGWDSATTMPDGGADGRSEQLSELGLIAHEIITDKKTADLIASAKQDSSNLDNWQQANLRNMERLWLHSNAVPAELVEALSRACSQSEFCWRTAKPQNDFKGFKPLFETVVSLSREVAEIKGAALGKSSYDALLDSFDPGRKSTEIDAIFAELTAFLPDFTRQAIEQQNQRPLQSLNGNFPKDKQIALFKDVIAKIGFDFSKGRLDESSHPFCGGVPNDIRITTRYRENDFGSALMGVIHETGHAMYESQLPAKWRYQPVGECHSMTMHESQSLFLEMQISRSAEFMEFLQPMIIKHFGANPLFSSDNLYRNYTRIEKGFIRVDADEITYPLHIILRYELEKKLIGREIEVADLPDAWNESFHKLFGLRPSSHAEGFMQDIHWPDGAFGYFPTYTLGALMAAQIKETMASDLPELPRYITNGDFGKIFDWLKEHFHQKGSLMNSSELIFDITNKPLSTAAFIRHLQNRYT